YINNGGDLLIAGEPGKQSVVNPILEQLGVQMMDGMVLQTDDDRAASKVRSFVTEYGKEFPGQVPQLYTYRENYPVYTPRVAGLIYNDNGPFDVEVLLKTDSSETWKYTGDLSLDAIR